MLKVVIRKGAKVKRCGGCSQAHGISDLAFIQGVHPINIKEFVQWTVEFDKVFSF
jgi:uncharacterized protein involved in oxidation of intracellular sulfur